MLLVILPIAAISQWTPPAGLVTWWPGDGNANDIVGSNEGVLEGGVTFVPGREGQAFSFDGASGYVSTLPALESPQTFSLSLWFKTATTQGGGLIGFGDSETGSSYNCDRNIYMDDGGMVHFGIWTGSVQLANSAVGYNDNNWHHVVGTCSPDTGISLYMDGILVGNNLANNPENYTGGWRIGETTLATTGVSWPCLPSSYYFNGQIEDITIFSRSLSPTEVAALYANGPPNANVPAIVGQPTNQVVQVGSLAFFVSWTTLVSDIHYQWQFNGYNIPNAINSDYIINSAAVTDSGSYTLVVSNNYGSVTSSIATLSILSPLNVIQTARTPTTAESTPANSLSPPSSPSQLMAYTGGIFTTNLATLDPNQMTIVLTHGWVPQNPLTGGLLFDENGPTGWPSDMAEQLLANGFAGNIVAWNWTNEATSSALHPDIAGSLTPTNGILLGKALLNTFGPSYKQKIHFVGHSFGTLVNSYAADFLQGATFASDPTNSQPWPATNMFMTLLDEAEVGTDANLSLDKYDLELLLGQVANPFQNSYPYYNPLPKQFAWAENYISAVGLMHTNAANFILTYGFPTSASTTSIWLNEFGSFHAYPVQWYEDSILPSTHTSGFGWSILWSAEDPAFANAPTNGSVYFQDEDTLVLSQTNWSFGTNYLAARYQGYLTSFWNEPAQPNDDFVLANGPVSGQLQVSSYNDDSLESLIINLNTEPNVSQSDIKVHPLGLTPDDNSSTNIPAYAWIQLVIPTNAISIFFNYTIQGNWAGDFLAVAINGTNVMSFAGSDIETNVVFGSGPIDISAYAGQTNEFFVGIVGGTSTNAQLTVENVLFSIAPPVSLQAQVNNNNLILSWPISEKNFSLQATTNLADPNSWGTLANSPSIVNLQNTVTNVAGQGNLFYRLISQ